MLLVSRLRLLDILPALKDRACAAEVWVKYAHRYLAEFQYRFNHRFNMKTILSHLLTALVACAPSYERHLRAAKESR